MPEQDYRLNDAEVMDFVVKGYLVLKPEFPEGFNEYCYEECARATADSNPGDSILELVPKLHDVWGHPMVRGALVSLVGEDFQMSGHRHCHVNPPGTRSQGWHQDGTNQRHHKVRTVLGFYYPQDTSADLGPTMIVPGTHFRNCPTDRMATYAHFRDQVALTCEAGTVAITHYDIWHGASRNQGDRVRYMLKFLFSRQGDPAAPSWRHDPEAAAEHAHILAARSAACGQSDHYKERGLRREMWNHLLGAGAA
ncbi:hypothetical protein HN371_17640 [Candidatus Poribacteria bacterium]|jgi:hypothetical protein|nr:hypothetical protein [Candidatus Poribacteria bacterium]MBT5532351.1 hypothetical protein [Candidatus Poribacteria bacterium]MBT5714664.1 hypothetical protein [Candidatus Poribacteria bacterium]MBT7100192.1 hypothetical protein [Candidatus Poribacteria bacterium]MBT7808567.1 hypothetical protein [Candidatus Poribacteria bacterium]